MLTSIVPQDKIESLWRIFCKFDSQSKGYVTLDDFYDKLIKYPRNGLTDQMTKIVGKVCIGIIKVFYLNKCSVINLANADVNNNGHLVFGEFLEVTYNITFTITDTLIHTSNSFLVGNPVLLLRNKGAAPVFLLCLGPS